jgi:NDP-sugar pyrophosphorylase family protein
MEAVILAGGQGTRLQPYTTGLPKPLVPIGDRPIIEILLEHLKSSGVSRVVVAVNHLAHLITTVVGDGSRFGLTIEYSSEDKPLSTVGPLKLIKNLPEDFLVINGDVLSDIDLQSLYRQHVSSDNLLTVAVSRRTEKIDYGVLELDTSGNVIDFHEKPDYHFVVSMGIYVFSRSLLEMVPENRAYGFDDLMYDLLRDKKPVGTVSHDGYWLDVGRVADYKQAQKDIAKLGRQFGSR